jgi:hypothetical protein
MNDPEQSCATCTALTQCFMGHRLVSSIQFGWICPVGDGQTLSGLAEPAGEQPHR